LATYLEKGYRLFKKRGKVSRTGENQKTKKIKITCLFMTQIILKMAVTPKMGGVTSVTSGSKTSTKLACFANDLPRG